jgi:hypothetical protein
MRRQVLAFEASAFVYETLFKRGLRERLNATALLRNLYKLAFGLST